MAICTTCRLPQLFIPCVQQTQVRRLTYQIRTPDKARDDRAGIAPSRARGRSRAAAGERCARSRTRSIRTSPTSGCSCRSRRPSGVLALVLASVGIYGVMALSVAQRTREIGIRMALGAIPRQILTMVLREASSLSAAAIALGVGASCPVYTDS